jgi:hypothetical protein
MINKIYNFYIIYNLCEWYQTKFYPFFIIVNDNIKKDINIKDY